MSKKYVQELQISEESQSGDSENNVIAIRE
jgi:hypothetical protein